MHVRGVVVSLAVVLTVSALTGLRRISATQTNIAILGHFAWCCQHSPLRGLRWRCPTSRFLMRWGQRWMPTSRPRL